MRTKEKTDWFMITLASVVIVSFVVCVWGIKKEIQTSQHAQEKLLKIQDNEVNSIHNVTKFSTEVKKHRL